MIDRAPLLRLVLLAAALLALPAAAQEKVLNLYTARHYQTDEALYANFTRQTGIRVNRIEGGEDALFERIKNEGANSPADVFITVDVGRLWRAEQAGVFARVNSPALESRVPPAYRDPRGQWFGFSARARVIAYNKSAVKPGEIRDYEELAEPKWKGRICIRSSSHPYNLSLVGAMIAHLGEQKAEEWLRGLKNNLARDPKGGDTDQLAAAAAGECDLAIANTYYMVRLMRSARAEDRAMVQKLGVVWPNQGNRGVHMNISGGGVLKNAPHRDAAVRFLEYLASDQAQAYFANGNNEWPVVPGVAISNPELESLGKFKVDAINVGLLGKNQPTAQRIADRAGYR
ncbi:MAG: Fe(3+) ABC transporter substrate-binding protein [Betaproteobacteria bacterium RIFCSPLOWO2_12_FULL_65_110]|nr:MAG: Fe(3+) ABC transporter substrate-binding protein [Betaproteobacteria bacterium RIFCSPLOWO2_12_FULL_65_110]